MDKNVTYKSGFTLIEVVLYIGIYTLLVGGVLISAFYLQRIMQYSSIEYKTQENIYMQLQLLQSHLVNSNHVEIGTSSIRIYSNSGTITQELRDGFIYMEYEFNNKPSKELQIYPCTQFIKFSFFADENMSTFQAENRLRVEVERLDRHGKFKGLKEWIYLSKS